MKPGHEGITYWIERLLDKISGTIANGLVSIPAVVLVAWVLVFVSYIVIRAIGKPWLFVEEFTAYFTVLAAAFSFAYTLRTDGHIKIDAITRLLPRSMSKVLETITLLVGLIITAYLTQKSIEWLVTAGLERGAHSVFPSDIPMWPIYLIVPIGFSALALVLVARFYSSIIRLVKGEVEGKEEKRPDIEEML